MEVRKWRLGWGADEGDEFWERREDASFLNGQVDDLQAEKRPQWARTPRREQEQEQPVQRSRGTGWRCLQSNRTPAQRNVRPIWEVDAEHPTGCWRTLPEDNTMLSSLHHTGASSVTDFGHYWWLFINVFSKHLLNILYRQRLFYRQCGKEWRSKHPCSQKASPLSYKKKEHKLVETIKMGKADEGLSREWYWKFNLKRGKGLSAQRQGGGTCWSSDIGWDDCIRETERTMGREQLGEGIMSAVS